MSLLLSNPLLENSGTKDKIIYILAKEWPLSTKELHQKLKKDFSISVSYQAVHKLIMNLLDTKVIASKERKYLLNVEWLKQTKNFLEQSEANYYEGSNGKNLIDLNLDLDSDEIKYVNFNYLHELREIFWLIEADQRRKMLNLPESERIICINLQHGIAALVNPENEFEHMNNLRKIKAKEFRLVKGNTLLDKWVKNFYETHDSSTVRVKTDAQDVAMVSEQWVYPTVLIEIYYNHDYIMKFDEIYNKVKNMLDYNLNEVFTELMRKPYKMKAVIHKDKDYIKTVREKTLKHFQ